MKFGKSSLEKLETCHEDLRRVMLMAIDRTNVDFGISEGYRTIERQNQLFLEGKSKIDGVNKTGKHNYSPSLACDIFIFHEDYEIRKKLVYDKIHLSYIAGIVNSCAVELYNAGEITHLIRWGGNWNGDGLIGVDQAFDDYPHFELIKPC